MAKEKSKSGRNKFDEKYATPDEAKKNIILKKVAAGGISRESSKEKSQLKLGGLDGSESRLDVMKSLDKKNHLQPEHGDKRLSKKLYSGKATELKSMGVGSHTQQQSLLFLASYRCLRHNSLDRNGV
ncbi:uncharacterized protein Fot_04173 [Forsythia ovata]|uniref:Uncharacterized protein n=1 Tax=Forsythia ovata TaxID=205694 RepID=A0ABD1XBU2_9LAMI